MERLIPLVCLCLSPPSAAERHQSEAEGFAAAEAGGPATGVHHRPFHTCHPAGVLHPGRPAGLRRIREPSLRLGPGIRLLHPGGAQLHDRGTSAAAAVSRCNHCGSLAAPLRPVFTPPPRRLSLYIVINIASLLKQ